MHTLIVDDHAFVCVGLKATLLDGLSDIQVSTASDGAAASDLLDSESIDLAIINLFMPGGDGSFDFISTVCETYPTLPVIVLSASESVAHIRKCLDLGAVGFVTKSAPKEILFKAVSTVVAGDVYMPEILFRSLSDLGEASDEFQTNVDSVTEVLTERQLDILQLISKGLSKKLIAHELHLSENTIKVHVSAILRALGLNNRTQAGLIGQTLENSNGSQPTETGNL